MELVKHIFIPFYFFSATTTSIICPLTTYDENGMCKPCHENCKDSCKGPEHIIGSNGCDACKANSLLTDDGLFCLKECPITEYPNVNGTCNPCHEYCQVCLGPNVDGCLACKYAKDGFVCVKECPNTKYADINKNCQPCHDNCEESCKGPNNTIGSNGCDACKDYKNDIGCVTECPAMKYPDSNKECKACHENCKDGCKGPENTIGSNGCDACKDVKDESFCVNECPTNKFDDSGVCKPCNEMCEQGCFGPGADSCVACKVTKDGSFCVNECPTGKYDDSGECKSCNENCAQGCSGPGADSCVTCKVTKDDSFCVNECPTTKFDDIGECKHCHENCAQGCSGPGADTCGACKVTKDGSFCVSECPISKFDDNGECKPCNENCAQG